MRGLFAALFAFVACATAPFVAGAADSEILEGAFRQDNALYVYRNDGEFNAFLREDITRICLSQIDLDSIEHNEFVVQEFHTPDSIFRIPLQTIDSVSFVQPKPVLSPRVIVLTKDYLPYITEVTERSISFTNDTPQQMMPKKGDVLVSEVFEGVLENGFAGVIDHDYGPSADQTTYYYTSATIDDIYDQLVFTSKSVTESSDDESWDIPEDDPLSRATGKLKTSIPTIRGSIGLASVEARPTVTIWATVNKNPDIKTRIQMIMAIESDVTAKIEAKAEVGDEIESWFGDRISIPTPVPGLRAFLKAGVFCFGSSSVSASLTSTGHFYRKFGFVVDDQVRQIDVCRSSISNPEMELFACGEIQAGICLRGGIEFVHEKLASAYLTCYAGLYAQSDISQSISTDSDGVVTTSINCYEDTSMEVGACISGEPGFTIMTADIHFDKDECDWIGALERRFVFRKSYVLPKFSDLKIQTGRDRITVMAVPERDIFLPAKLGVAIRKWDSWGDDYAQIKWVDTDYYNEAEWPKGKLKVEFEGLRPMQVYTVIPVVRLFDNVFHDFDYDNYKDVTIPAEVVTGEAKDITSSSAILYGSTPSDIDFDEWQSQGFYVSTLADCDPESSETRYYTTDQTGPEFSCVADGLDADTKYYYRAFIGNNDQFFGKIRSFTTEEGEEEAPCEAVDLGLSVLWGSANFGTSDCLEPGDFYAWAETNTKFEYTPENCSSLNVAHSDIKGSNYDPVHRKYHGNWRMPTKREFEELLDKCTIVASKIEYLESVYDPDRGCMLMQQVQKDVIAVIGPNGNSIVLPYTGAYDGSSLEYDDQIFYWTSTPVTGANDRAYSFWIDYFGEHISIDSTSRHFGLPIRPVRDR